MNHPRVIEKKILLLINYYIQIKLTWKYKSGHSQEKTAFEIFNILKNQLFIAPSATPFIKYFCKDKNTIISGITAIRTLGKIISQGLPN